MDAYPDSVRRIVLEKESRQADPSVMRYAVQRWGGRARSLLGDILHQRLESGSLVEDDVTLLSEMTPTTPTQRQHVMQVACDSARSFNLRWAAVQALGRSPDVEAELLAAWLQLIEDDQTDVALRSGALDAMAELARAPSMHNRAYWLCCRK